MNKSGLIKRSRVHEKLVILPAGKAWERLVRILIPVLLALLVIAGLFIPARLAGSRMPQVQKGVLNLADWSEKEAFAVSGQWEFYWDCLLSNEQIRDRVYTPVLVDAPSKWSYYEIDGENLPEKGKATYHIQVKGAQTDEVYGVRIKDMRNAYRLYVDGVLIAQNGSFDDDSSAPASAYRPQLVSFTPTSNAITYAMTVQTVSCIFFLTFFLVQRKEKEALILSILAADILLRLSIIGDALYTMFPNISAVWLNRIYLLCTPWAEFLLLYFLYLAYGGLVPKWQVVLLFAYSTAVSLFILFFPIDIITAAHQTMNYILLLAMVLVTGHLVRASWQGRQGGPLFCLLCR